MLPAVKRLRVLLYVALCTCFYVAKKGPGDEAAAVTDEMLRPIFTPESLKQHMQNWMQLANKTFDASREGRISRMLRRNSGIYRNRTKAKKIALQNTVLVSVISLVNGVTTDLYKEVLGNWLCFTAHYDYKPVVYYLSPPSSNSSSSTQGHSNIDTNIQTQNYLNELRKINPNALFIEYPTHLFWSLLTQKTRWTGLAKKRTNVDFKGDYPSFTHHGALVMLVPAMEVLSLGFSVVYLDIDIALVKDPIPFMTIGTVICLTILNN